MEVPEILRRRKGEGRAQEERKHLRAEGKKYVRKNKVVIPAKTPPNQQVVCKCQFLCKRIKHDQKLRLFGDFYGLKDLTKQNTYAMSLIHICKIKRRRSSKLGENEVDEEKSVNSRNVTVKYTLPDGEGNVVEVCKKTFCDVFKITKRRVATLIQLKKSGNIEYIETRGNKVTHRKFTLSDEKMVIDHINSFPRQESHYCREKTNREFLSQDLNIRRMFLAFKTMFPDSSINERYYREVFKKHFNKLSFQQPRTDTCGICDLLNAESRNSPGNRCVKQKLELHHRKAEKALKAMKLDNIKSQEINSELSSAAMDLQKVLSLPTLTHGDMYYMRQLSTYNFNIHLADNSTGYMFLWHEGQAGRGGNEIASCVLKGLTSNITRKKVFTMWSDNCVGQNKNKMFVFLWLYLTVKGHFQEINQKFLVKGHTFMQCDRDFALIEKRKRIEQCEVPMDLVSMIIKSNNKHPFLVTVMNEEDFFDIKHAANLFIDTKKIQISKAQCIRVNSANPGVVHVKQSFSEIEEWKQFNVFKKGVKQEDLANYQLPRLQSINRLSEAKKKDLKAMIPFLKNESKTFYENLVM